MINKIKNVFRKNNEIRLNTGFEDEQVISSSRSRYSDKLIEMNTSDIMQSYFRELVSEYDAIASILTQNLPTKLFTKMPKFYINDQRNGVEVMQDLRSFLQSTNFLEICARLYSKVFTHGWAIAYPYIDRYGDIACEIYSDYMIPSNQIFRDEENRITMYRVSKIPRLPLFRNRAQLKQINRLFQADDIIHVYRNSYNFGFGVSIISNIWDAITKLREESHSNAFRSKVFPIIKVDTDWDDAQIDTFLEVVSRLDMNRALVTRAGLDSEGKNQPELPAIQWATPAASSQGKSSQGSSAQISDLSSEWARLCGGSGRTMAYFTGSGIISSSLAAGSEDTTADEKADINDFNCLQKTFLIPFIKWIAQTFGFIVPSSFTIKCYLEWEHDEKLQAQQAQQAKLEDIKKDTEMIRENLAYNQLLDVNSESGNVKKAILTKGQNGESDSLYVQYKSPYNWYRYQDPSKDLSSIGDRVVTEGGEAVWRDLRGKTQSYSETGVPDSLKGLPKRSFAKDGRKPVPFAGKVEDIHGTAYSTVSNPPTQESQEPQEPQEQPPEGGDDFTIGFDKKKTKQKMEIEKDQPTSFESFTPMKFLGFDIQPGPISPLGPIPLIKVFNGSNVVKEAEKQAYLHYLLKEYGSINKIRENKRWNYKKTIEIIEKPENIQLRRNLAQCANGFHVNNPFFYIIDDKPRIEYITEEEIKQNVGKIVPFGVFHNLDDSGNPSLPEWQIIGYYRINDVKNGKDVSEIQYYDDWEKRVKLIQDRINNGNYNLDNIELEFIQNFITLVKQNKISISTAITTIPKYDYKNQRWNQTNVILHSVSAVPRGNCDKPFCSIQVKSRSKVGQK